MPLSGVVALRADRGLFNIDQVDLQTTATKLKATGQFSFSGDSNLQVDLNSSDASELQAVLISSGLLPDVEEQMRSLRHRARRAVGVQRQLSEENSARRTSMAGFRSARCWLTETIWVRLSAALKMTAAELRIADGRLTERDGGGMQFTLNAPRTGENNTTLDATLDRVNAGNLLAALPLSRAHARRSLRDTQSDASGQIKITGIPNAMSGSADLRFGPGRLARRTAREPGCARNFRRLEGHY